MKAAAIICALAITTAVSLPARADEPESNDRTVAVVASKSSPLLQRLTKEMNLAGLEVKESAGDPAESRPTLIVLVPEDPEASIEIWTVSGGITVLAATVPAEGPDDTRALRVAELARALVFNPSAPVEPAPAAIESPAPAAAAAPRPTPPPPISPALDAVVVDRKPPPRVAPPFDFGVATGVGFQSPGVSMQIEATATLWPHEYVGVGFFGSAPVVAASIEAPTGTAAVRSALFAAELATAPAGRDHDMFALLLNPGLAFNYLHVSGTGQRPEQDRTGDKPLVAAYGRAELRARMAGPVSLRASALAGAALPPVDIRFQGRVVSTICPLGAASLGIVVEP
ncbi:MAG: hypothetical protein HOV80_27940 [Polyangiaceae bacterium]|nr:hypothetical protein [Polyangiaceae bacterium]